MKVTDYIASFLSERKVAAVYEMSGGMITHLLDSLYRLGETQIVSTHHEQAAGFAAEGYARMSGVPGVAMATSGPGATNLLTAIGSCYFDSTPTVFITGQVNRHEQKGDRAIRQLGFQETNIVEMARPITKDAWMIREPADVPTALVRAFDLATSGRPGPVLLDIPMDVQRGDVVNGFDATRASEQRRIADASAFFVELYSSLAEAKKPVVLAGGGIRAARCAQQFANFAERLGVPVVHSLMAVDVLPYTHRLRCGMIGTYGNRWANIALCESDVVLVLGSRLDVRQTGSDTGAFAAGKEIFHVDCEQGEMNNRVTGCRTLHANLTEFLDLALATDIPEVDAREWLAEISSQRQTWPDDQELGAVSGINPNTLMHQVSDRCQHASAFIVDVGQHQMWAAQSLRLVEGQRFLTSGGMGSMGFALPAAIGAAKAVPDRPCIVIAGDGGFQSNIQELETIRRYQLPIKIIVVNNLCHGMVRQFQESYFDGRYQSTYWGYSAPDFSKVAAAYGIESRTCSGPQDVAGALTSLMHNPHTPGLLQVMVDTFANAYPKVAFGRPISDMEPHAKPVDIEST